MSRLDYCNGLLYGTVAVHVKLGKLQRLQNAAGRLVYVLGMIISHHP